MGGTALKGLSIKKVEVSATGDVSVPHGHGGHISASTLDRKKTATPFLLSSYYCYHKKQLQRFNKSILLSQRHDGMALKIQEPFCPAMGYKDDLHQHRSACFATTPPTDAIAELPSTLGFNAFETITC